MKRETQQAIQQISDGLSICSTFYEYLSLDEDDERCGGYHFMSKETSLAEKYVQDRPDNASPSETARLRQVSRLLSRSAETMRAWDLDFLAARMEALAAECENLSTSEEPKSPELQHADIH